MPLNLPFLDQIAIAGESPSADGSVIDNLNVNHSIIPTEKGVNEMQTTKEHISIIGNETAIKYKYSITLEEESKEIKNPFFQSCFNQARYASDIFIKDIKSRLPKYCSEEDLKFYLRLEHEQIARFKELVRYYCKSESLKRINTLLDEAYKEFDAKVLAIVGDQSPHDLQESISSDFLKIEIDQHRIWKDEIAFEYLKELARTQEHIRAPSKVSSRLFVYNVPVKWEKHAKTISALKYNKVVDICEKVGNALNKMFVDMACPISVTTGQQLQVIHTELEKIAVNCCVKGKLIEVLSTQELSRVREEMKHALTRAFKALVELLPKRILNKGDQMTVFEKANNIASESPPVISMQRDNELAATALSMSQVAPEPASIVVIEKTNVIDHLAQLTQALRDSLAQLALDRNVLEEQRSLLESQRAALIEAQSQMSEDRKTAESQRSEISKQLKYIEDEKEKLRKLMDELMADKASLIEKRSQLNIEKQDAEAMQSKLVAERKIIDELLEDYAGRNEQLIRLQDALNTERDLSIKDRECLQQERISFENQKKELVQERQELDTMRKDAAAAPELKQPAKLIVDNASDAQKEQGADVSEVFTVVLVGDGVEPEAVMPVPVLPNLADARDYALQRQKDLVQCLTQIDTAREVAVHLFVVIKNIGVQQGPCITQAQLQSAMKGSVPVGELHMCFSKCQEYFSLMERRRHLIFQLLSLSNIWEERQESENRILRQQHTAKPSRSARDKMLDEHMANIFTNIKKTCDSLQSSEDVEMQGALVTEEVFAQKLMDALKTVEGVKTA